MCSVYLGLIMYCALARARAQCVMSPLDAGRCPRPLALPPPPRAAQVAFLEVAATAAAAAVLDVATCAHSGTKRKEEMATGIDPLRRGEKKLPSDPGSPPPSYLLLIRLYRYPPGSSAVKPHVVDPSWAPASRVPHHRWSMG